MKFCIMDMSNLIHRAKQVVGKQTDSDPYDPFAEATGDEDKNRVGLIFTVVFQGMLKAYERFNCDHMVAAFDARSWRRDYYEGYKGKRRNKEKTEAEAHDQELIIQAMDELRSFLQSYTNVTVLYADGAEADDLIARWVQLHSDPVFKNIIVSADSDFKQLVRENIWLFDPMTPQRLFTTDGVFYQDGRRPAKGDITVEINNQTWKAKINKKTGEVERFDPKWELFYKCIRGDDSDSISAAWPRVHTTKMRKAFEGDVTEWNNFINSTWGKDDDKKSVRELYERNQMLIDLTQQPQEMIDHFDTAIDLALSRDRSRLVGAHFAKFCGKWRLSKLLTRANLFSNLLAESYD